MQGKCHIIRFVETISLRTLKEQSLGSILTPLNCRSTGDEIRLRHNCCGVDHKAWAGVGNVVKLSDTSEEILVELKGNAPTSTTVGWTAEFVWKSTSFDRMQRAMKFFAVDDTSVSSYLYHRCYTAFIFLLPFLSLPWNKTIL